MNTVTDVSASYRGFTDALTGVLAEAAAKPERRSRLARARAPVKRHPVRMNMNISQRSRPPSPIGNQCRTLAASKVKWLP
jgi:hypothetical protein